MSSTQQSKTGNIAAELSQILKGQPSAVATIAPYYEMYASGLAPEGRPVGVFLLLGPTGTGKTKTVEALAEVLHGSEKNVLKVDCGEFQMDHEVSKLIGSPPGYMGHRETQPMLTQQKINAVSSEKCKLSLVLFDEIEKAAPSLTRLMLGILDKATLRLGDNSAVCFERCMIFMTSNLGAREMMNLVTPQWGFGSVVAPTQADLAGKLEDIAMVAVRKKFSPEFVNRIDSVITYQPLSPGALADILDERINALQAHVNTRLGARSITLSVPFDVRQFLLNKGTSQEYGARELNRTIHRQLTQPLAMMLSSGQINPGSRVEPKVVRAQDRLELVVVEPGVVLSNPPVVRIVIVDDNRDLAYFLERILNEMGYCAIVAESSREFMKLTERRREKFQVALFDYILPGANGVDMAVTFAEQNPEAVVMVMTGAAGLRRREARLCKQNGLPVLWKPFLVQDVVAYIEERLGQNAAGAGAA